LPIMTSLSGEARVDLAQAPSGGGRQKVPTGLSYIRAVFAREKHECVR
jgi:hypothetical protein